MAYIVRRLEFFVVTLWAALTINFFLPRLMPGNPAEAMIARFHGRINPQALGALEAAFGVNRHDSLLSQYFQYLGDVFRGQFGISLSYFPDTVSNVVLSALPWTLGLIGVTTVISFLLVTFIGILSAWWRGGVVDSLLPPVFIVISGLPYFWVGLIFIYFFSFSLRWLPMGFGVDAGTTTTLSWTFIGQALSHAILPALTITITSIGGWILTMRNNMITTLSEDYVKMARAKGLHPLRIMLLYAGRNAVLPNITGFALSLGFVISGALLTEIVFSYPGVGYLLYQAVTNEDYPLMQAVFLFITVAVLIAVLLSDIANALLDPRTRDRR
jgi:peptide/nickel transport system permease protein